MNLTTVYFDGSCPLCAREIGFYRRCRGGDRIAWVDVSVLQEAEVLPGLSKSAALGRFHVKGADGHLLSGGRAFAHLWSVLPAFRALGVVLQIRPLSWLADRLYDLFLRVRPRLQKAVSRSECQRGSSQCRL